MILLQPGPARRLVLLAFATLAASIAPGCVGDGDEALLGPRAQRVGSELRWELKGGASARAVVVGGGALSIVARRDDGSEFGFVLRDDGFEEWAVDAEGRKDVLRCRVDGDREHYDYNGQRFVLVAEDLQRHATFGEAMRAQVRTKRPYEESLLLSNELGQELLRSLEALGEDPTRIEGVDAELAARILGPDGRCSSELLQILAVCARLKCMYGGPSNLVCNACTGALVGCAIITIARGLGLG